jgi:hypothetical protein
MNYYSKHYEELTGSKKIKVSFSNKRREFIALFQARFFNLYKPIEYTLSIRANRWEKAFFHLRK